jgi:ATP-dependent RNA helicase RhlE
MTFHSLGLNDALIRAINDQGYHKPTAIQARAIPAVLSGKDILASAQTGTGKTAGFTLPILQRLSDKSQARANRNPRALVLSPTRELAAQVGASVRAYGRYLPVRSDAVFGGVKIGPQISRIRDGLDIVVATPGRLLDHMSQRTIDLSSVECLVLDEADRMLDMGFIQDIRRIVNQVPKSRQTLMFSATFSNEIRRLADGMLRRPETIDVAPRNKAVDRIDQWAVSVPREGKRELLSQLITSNGWYQVLVFTRTKHGANRLAQQLDRDGLVSAAIHGNKSQGARTRALESFKSGKVQVLVATDIAARGLDIERLPHVVNYELPNVSEDYVHRIGRTGRAGQTGEAISLVSPEEIGLLSDIEKLIGQQVPRVTRHAARRNETTTIRTPGTADQSQVTRTKDPGGRKPKLSKTRVKKNAGKYKAVNGRKRASRPNRNHEVPVLLGG